MHVTVILMPRTAIEHVSRIAAVRLPPHRAFCVATIEAEEDRAITEMNQLLRERAYRRAAVEMRCAVRDSERVTNEQVTVRPARRVAAA